MSESRKLLTRELQDSKLFLVVRKGKNETCECLENGAIMSPAQLEECGESGNASGKKPYLSGVSRTWGRLYFRAAMGRGWGRSLSPSLCEGAPGIWLCLLSYRFSHSVGKLRQAVAASWCSPVHVEEAHTLGIDFRSKDGRNKNLAGFSCSHSVKWTLYILKNLTFTVKLRGSSCTHSQPHTEIKPWYCYPRIGSKGHWLLQANGPES